MPKPVKGLEAHPATFPQCKMALHLPKVTEVLRSAGVTEVGHLWCRVLLAVASWITGYVSADYISAQYPQPDPPNDPALLGNQASGNKTSTVSERQLCRVIGCCRITIWYQASLHKHPELRKRVKASAKVRRGFGHRPLHEFLQHEGPDVEHIRLSFIWREKRLPRRWQVVLARFLAVPEHRTGRECHGSP